jgi:hypothetical protein
MPISPTRGSQSLARRVFPHRQFYLRSRGAVQFFEFSPAFQMMVCGAALALVCWAVYASAVVVFKEQIISAKNQRYTGMQTAYETHVTEMQRAYDELSGLLVFAEERFQNATRDLETRRKQLTALLTQKQAMDQQRRDVTRETAVMERYSSGAERSTTARKRAPSRARSPRSKRRSETPKASCANTPSCGASQISNTA